MAAWLVGWLLIRVGLLVWLGLRAGWHLLGLLVLAGWNLGVWLVAAVLAWQQPDQADTTETTGDASAPVVSDAAEQPSTVQRSPTQELATTTTHES